MPGRRYTCTLLEAKLLTPTVLGIKFKPNKPFRYEAGQFISLIVPTANKPIRRLYSLATSYEAAQIHGYELCIKLQPGGKGGTYLKNLKLGEKFSIVAPYGDFKFHPNRENRPVCFICTSTGMGPIRAIIESKVFQISRPSKVICLVGVKSQEEKLYEGVLERVGVFPLYCVSSENGRVTDQLKALELIVPWRRMDFYLCGNAGMIREVEAFLTCSRNVSLKNIFKDAFQPMAGTEPRVQALNSL